jgi:hypothetical protein
MIFNITDRFLLVLICIAFTNTAFAQTCINSLPKSTPTEDFIVHNDGTTTHKKTGLMWSVCSYGQIWQNDSCIGAASGEPWNIGTQYVLLSSLAGQLDLYHAGYNDWREPNIKELASIIETSCHSPAINAAIFPSTPQGIFWSSSPVALDDNNAWVVYFGNGYDWVRSRLTGNYGYIRFVRETN